MSGNRIVRTAVYGGLAAVLASSLLAGCSKDTGGAATAPTPPAPKKDDKPIEISWFGDLARDVADDSYVQQEIEKRFNVKIKVIHSQVGSADKGRQLLTTKIGAGEIPDLMKLADPADVMNFAKQGILLEIPKGKIQEKMPFLVKDIDSIDKGLWALSSYQGKNYALPMYETMPGPRAISWRKDLLDMVGISKVPETINEMEAAFKAVKEREKELIEKSGAKVKNIWGMTERFADYGANAGFSEIFGAYGVQPGQWMLDPKTNKLVRGEVMPGAKEALETLNRWYKAGYIDPEFITVKAPDPWFTKWRTGGLLSQWKTITTGEVERQTWPDRVKDELEKNLPNSFNVGGPPPKGPQGHQGAWSWGSRSNFIAISKNVTPEKLDKIMEILNSGATDLALNDMLRNGKEGEHWTWVLGGPKRKDEFMDHNKPEVQKIGISGEWYSPFKSVEIRKKDNERKKAAGNPGVDWGEQMYAKYGKNPTRDAIYGLPLATDAKYKDSFMKKMRETFAQIIVGEKPVSEWDQFVKWFQDNGGAEWTADANKLYDEQFRNVK